MMQHCPLFFNIFINDLHFYSLRNSNPYNFADDNIISEFVNEMNFLLNILQKESAITIKLFHKNNVIVNPAKF